MPCFNCTRILDCNKRIFHYQVLILSRPVPLPNYGTENFWGDVGNRRELFINLAKKLNIDYLNPEHWYSVGVRGGPLYEVFCYYNIAAHSMLLVGGEADFAHTL